MRIAIALIAAAMTLGACGQPPQIYVDKGYIRLGAAPNRPAAAYFTLHGGASDATVISVSTEVAIKSEMHESMMQGNVSSMKPIDRLPLPAESKIVFKPGGKHVMLFDVNPGIKPGRTTPLIFTFSDGQRIQYDAKVIAAGDPAPGG
jgi:periplasmic copper chaperone A